jgi:hypothetical protein
MPGNNTSETPESIANQKETLSEIIQGTVYDTSFNIIGFLDAAENLDSSQSTTITTLANDIKGCIKYMKNDTEDMEQVGLLLYIVSIPVIQTAYYYKYSNSEYDADPNKWFFNNNGTRKSDDADEWVNWTNLTGFPRPDSTRNENAGVISVARLALIYARAYTEEMLININSIINSNSASLTKDDVVKMAKISFKALRGWIGCKENLEIIQSGATAIKTREETRIGTSIEDPDDASRTIFSKIPTNAFDFLVYQATYSPHPTHSHLPSYWPGDGTEYGGYKYTQDGAKLEWKLQTQYTPGVYIGGTLDPFTAGGGRYKGKIRYDQPVQLGLIHGWVMPESVWNPPDYSHNAIYTTPQVNSLNRDINDYNHNQLNLFNLFTLDASNGYVTGTISDTNFPKVGLCEDTVDRDFALKAAKAIEDWVPPGILPAKTKVLIQDKSDESEGINTTDTSKSLYHPQWDPYVKYWDSFYIYDTSM